MDILGPVDIQYLVFGLEAFAIGHICTGKYVGIRWGCIGGGVVEVPIFIVENGRCLEHAQVDLSALSVLGSFNRD